MTAHAIRTSALETIGGTPLVRLRHLVPDGSADVRVTLEGGNPTGIYKDRIALAVIEAAEQRGTLQPGHRVVEFSGGSTGSSLAFVCAVKGYPLSIVSSDAFSQEKLATMRAFGADLTLVPSKEGHITADLFVRMREVADRIVERDGAYWVDQFHNTDRGLGYATMGREIVEHAAASGVRIDAFCAGVGTAGMLTGVASALRNQTEPALCVRVS